MIHWFGLWDVRKSVVMGHAMFARFLRSPRISPGLVDLLKSKQPWGSANGSCWSMGLRYTSGAYLRFKVNEVLTAYYFQIF